MLSVASACSSSSGGGASSTGTVLRSKAKLPAPFTVPLPIPPVLKPVRSDAAADYYEMTQMPAKVQILPGLQTEIWGYNGIFPGPTIEARSGRQIVVHQRNGLPVPTVTHLHGGVTPPDSDGYPTDLVLPAGGATGIAQAQQHANDAAWSFQSGEKVYTYPLQQRAATLWYHDHRMDFTGPEVYRGLAGFQIVRDDEDDSLPLPKGEREIPLMICDRAFAQDGSFLYPSVDSTLREQAGVPNNYMQGVLGDVILVNGAPWPFVEVTNTRYRLRLLNASNARRYKLALNPQPRKGPSFRQVGSDQGLLMKPVDHQAIEIAQAERFDVVVDFSAYPVGTNVTLTNQFGEGSASQVMRFHVVGQARDESTVPAHLSSFQTLRRSDAAVTRQFNFNQGNRDVWMINGKPFDPGRMDARPRLGTTEIWRLTTDQHHPVHLHLVHFQILSRDGRSPGAYDAGWKDTIDLGPSQDAEIIATFSGYRGRFVFHCHNLEHEDMAMMANFDVV